MFAGGALDEHSEGGLPHYQAGGSTSQNSSLGVDNSVDTRRFRSGAVVLGFGGLAVEKTLQSVWKTRISAESRSVESNSSLASEHALSIGPGLFQKPQLNSLTDEQRLTAACWEAFQASALQQGDHRMDKGSRGVPVAGLVLAIRRISKSLSPQDLADIVRERQYPSNAVLSFREFQQLVLSILSPAKSSSALPTRSTKKAPGAPYSTWSISDAPPPHHPPPPRHTDHRDKSAYQRLLQKQRGASSVVLSQLSPEACTAMGVSESVTDLDGHKVATSKVNEAMLQVFRNEARQAEKQKSIHEPLLKHKVYGMTHSSETYAAKWERMRAQREGRMEREVKRATRSDMIETLNRLVLISDRRGIALGIERRERELAHRARENVVGKMLEEQEAAERAWRKQEEDLAKKRDAASQLKAALSEASLFTKSQIEEELDEKKQRVVPFQLNPSSSALLTVPDEITVKVKKARSLEGYNAAKQAEKDYLEQTLDNRIKRFSQAKYEKMFKAADVGVRIAITPFTPLYTKPLSSPAARRPPAESGVTERARESGGFSVRGDLFDNKAETVEDDLDAFAMRAYLDRQADDDSVNPNRSSPTNTSP